MYKLIEILNPILYSDVYKNIVDGLDKCEGFDEFSMEGGLDVFIIEVVHASRFDKMVWIDEVIKILFEVHSNIYMRCYQR